MEIKNGKKKLNAWIDMEVLAKVAEKAKKENRSVSNMIETILAKAMENE